LWPTTKSIIVNKKQVKRWRFDGHADTAVQCGVNHPMERIRGFMQSH
jgi:hypothetical protein